MGQDSSNPSLEQRVAALEEKVESLEASVQRSNENNCETLEELARVLLDARNDNCELPPGCEGVLEITTSESGE